MKKAIIFILLLISFLFVPGLELRAEVFPYRSLSITVIGVDDDYVFEILHEGEIPNLKEQEKIYINYYNRFGKTVPNFYKTFTDDGYIISSFYRGKDFPLHRGEHTYFYNDSPLTKFKVMLIFEDEIYVTSKIIETTLYNPTVLWDLTNETYEESKSNIGTIYEDIPYSNMAKDFISRIILVIVLEMIILYLFGFRYKKSFLLALLMSFIAQTIMVIYMFKAKYYTNPILGEYVELIVNGLLMIFVKGFVYGFFLNEKSFQRAFFYNLVANFSAIGLNVFLMIMSWKYF